jgi:hypothetical protein
MYMGSVGPLKAGTTSPRPSFLLGPVLLRWLLPRLVLLDLFPQPPGLLDELVRRFPHGLILPQQSVQLRV